MWNHVGWDVENSKGVWETEVRWRSVIDQTGMDGWAGRCWTELLDCAASTRLHVATDSEARMPADAHPEMPPAPVLLMHATRTHPRAPPHSAQGRQRMAISARISAKRSPHGADAESSAINPPSGITNQALFGDRSCASRASRVKSRNHRRAPNPTLASALASACIRMPTPA
jgi:hypothetical protein